MKLVHSSLAAVFVLASSGAFAADSSSPTLTLKDHVFLPQELTIPADKRVVLTVINNDSTPAEFESHDLKVEKIVAGGGQVTVRVGPLKAGTYAFFDDFHEDTTRGTLIAK